MPFFDIRTFDTIARCGEFPTELPDAAQLQVTLIDVADRAGFGGIDDQPPLANVIAQRRHAAHPHALALGGSDLVADALAGHLALELAKESSTLSVSRPIEVVVLNCWVTATKDTRAHRTARRSWRSRPASG